MSSQVSPSTSARNIRADRIRDCGAPDGKHAVRGECAASGHRRERRPQGEREVGSLAARYDLEEGELLLASDRRRGGRPAQQGKTADRSRQWLADLCDCRRPPPPVGEAGLYPPVSSAALDPQGYEPPH